MRNNKGASLILILVFSIFCIFIYSSSLQKLASSSSSKDPFRNTPVAGGKKKSTLKSTAHLSSTGNPQESSQKKVSNITLETPWSAINESTLGIHLYSHNIENIRLIGERHAGTTFLARHLKHCFPDRSIGDFFVSKKHWMQPSPDYIIEAARKYGEEGLEPTILPNEYDAKTWWQIANAPDPKSVFNTSLVIAIFRNPYDWMEAMRNKPWHWPNHLEVLPRNSSILTTVSYKKPKEPGVRRRRLQATPTEPTGSYQSTRTKARIYDTPKGESIGGKLPTSGSPSVFQKSFITKSILDWKDFVDRPMRLLDYQEINTDNLCQKGYSFGSISPCHRNNSYVPTGVKHIPRPFLQFLPFGVNDVVYELAGNGKPYEHPLQLRAAKIQNFLGLVQEWELGGFGIYRYDDILGDGLTVLVQEISRALGVESRCPVIAPFEKAHYLLPPEFRAWITNHSDWESESLIGFAPEKE